MATAGLKRGGFEDRISHRLNWYHAVSQGALGVECRSNDGYVVRKILASLVDQKTMLECMAERVLMKCLEGGCSVPIGVKTRWSDNNNHLTLEAIVLSLDGIQRVEASAKQNLDTVHQDGQHFTLSQFTDIIVDHYEEDFKVRLQNSVLLGTTLAQKMIEMGVKDILANIQRDK